MVTATQRPNLQPGVVSVVHTAGDLLGWHPHVHAVASRGGWDADGEWVPVPLVGTREAERLFQRRVITLLHDMGLLSEERGESADSPAEPSLPESGQSARARGRGFHISG